MTRPPTNRLVADNEYNFLLAPVNQLIQQETQQKSDALRELIVTDAYWKGRQTQYGLGSVDSYELHGSQGFDRKKSYEQSLEPEEAHTYNVNVMRKYVRKYAAVLGTRAPNVHGVPIDPRNPDHVQRAELAKLINQIIESTTEPEYAHMRLVWGLAKSGTMYSYTRWEWDKDRWGSTTTPIFEEQEVPIGPHIFSCPACGTSGLADQAVPDLITDQPTCPECQTPVQPQPSGMVTAPRQTGALDLPNGSLVTEYFSRAEVIHPHGVRSIQETPWIAVLTESDRGVLARHFGIPIEELPPRSSALSGALMRTVREQQRSSETLHQTDQDAVTWGRVWLRPSQYELYPPQQRERLHAEFPDGLRMAVVDNRIVGRPQSSRIDDHWAACEPEPDETLNVRGYLSDIPPLADAINDSLSYLILSLAHSTPINLVDGTVIDPNALERRGGRHGDFIVTRGKNGRSMRDAVHSIRPSEFRADSANVRHVLDSEIQEVSGLMDTIYGGGTASPTAYEAEMRKNQALAILGLTWQMCRRFHAQRSRQAVMEVAKHSAGRMDTGYAPADFVAIPDASSLLEGGWTMKAEEAMPQNPGQIRQFLMDMMNAAPQSMAEQFAHSLGLLHPDNLEFVATTLSIPGLRSPEVEMSRAIGRLIQELLAEQPMEDQGMIFPSRAAQPVIYTPSLVLDKIRSFVISEDGQRTQIENPIGMQNVLAYAEEYDRILNPPLPPEEVESAEQS